MRFCNCTFVSPYAKSRFSRGAAQFKIYKQQQKFVHLKNGYYLWNILCLLIHVRGAIDKFAELLYY